MSVHLLGGGWPEAGDASAYAAFLVEAAERCKALLRRRHPA